MSSENPFATEEAWSVSTGGILPAGEHLVEIYEVEGDGTSSGGYPQIVVKASNADGSITDWIVVIPSTIGKVVQLTDAAGLERPTDAQVEADGPGYRLDPKYVAKLVGKQVGVVVRDEADRNDPTKIRQRVAGWVAPGVVKKSDVPSDASDFQAPATVSDDDIPFRWDGAVEYDDLKTRSCRPLYEALHG
jgi:hypothetical protein